MHPFIHYPPICPSIQDVRETCAINAESLSCYMFYNLYVFYIWIIEIKHIIFFLSETKVLYKLFKA